MMDVLIPMLPWLVVAGCIIGEAFFAASELSIVSANRIRLEEASRSGSKAAQRVLWFREQPDRLFGTTLLGTNFSTVTGSTVASLTLVQIDPARGDWWAMLLMAPLVLIAGEIIPKSVGQARADDVSKLLVTPLYVIHTALTPLLFFVTGYTKLLYRVVGIEHGEGKSIVSREELALLVRPETESEGIEEDEREMIARIFAFNSLRARDSMVPLAEMVAVAHDTTVEEAVAVVERVGFSRLPVFEDRIDNVVGILHHLDLLSAADKNELVSRYMRRAHFTPETQDVDELMFLLQREAASAAIIVDEFGGAVGLITLEDIIEEIVGEIHDEFDSTTGLWRSVEDGHLIDARAQVESVNENFNLSLPMDQDYETIAGFVLEELRHIPRVGEAVRLPDGRMLTVQRATARAIQELHLSQ